MAAGDIYKLRAQWFQPTTLQTAENTLYFEQGTIALVLDTPEEDLVQGFIEHAVEPYQQCMHSNYQLERVQVYVLPADLLTYEQLIESTIGGQGSDMLDPVSAGGLRFRSAHLGRRGRSHIAVGPVSEVVNTNLGRPNGTEVEVLQAFAEGLLAMNVSVGLTTTNWIWSVYSYADGAGYPVTGYSVSPIWYTEKSRKR